MGRADRIRIPYAPLCLWCALAAAGDISPAIAQARQLDVTVECRGDLGTRLCGVESRTNIATEIQKAVANAFPFFDIRLAMGAAPGCGQRRFTLFRTGTDWFLDGEFRRRENCADDRPLRLKLTDPIARTKIQEETPPLQDFPTGASKVVTDYLNADPKNVADILRGIPLGTGILLDTTGSHAPPVSKWRLQLPVDAALWDTMVVGTYQVSYQDDGSTPHTLEAKGFCRSRQGNRTIELADLAKFPCDQRDGFGEEKHVDTLRSPHHDLIYITSMGDAQIGIVDCAPAQTTTLPVRGPQ